MRAGRQGKLTQVFFCKIGNETGEIGVRKQRKEVCKQRNAKGNKRSKEKYILE